jgi:hypothetical protein
MDNRADKKFFALFFLDDRCAFYFPHEARLSTAVIDGDTSELGELRVGIDAPEGEQTRTHTKGETNLSCQLARSRRRLGPALFCDCILARSRQVHARGAVRETRRMGW